MARLTKLDRMTVKEKVEETIKFWAADNNATFAPEVLAIVFEKSLTWFQFKRCAGGGIPYYKQGRTILYKNKMQWSFFLQKTAKHTTTDHLYLGDYFILASLQHLID